MIDKQKLIETVNEALAGTDYFPVEIAVKPGNNILVEIDSDNGVDIDFCVELTRRIESVFDRDVEDYELEVGSAGITTPLRVPRQFINHIGKEIEVQAKDGKKHRGILKSYDESDGSMIIVERQKVKLPDRKRPEVMDVEVTFTPEQINAVIPMLEF